MINPLSWIESSLARYAVFVGAAYAIGAALDGVATKELKNTAAGLIRRDYPSLTGSAITSVVDIYNSIFSERVFSKRFTAQSLYIYSTVLITCAASSIIFSRGLSLSRVWFSASLGDPIYISFLIAITLIGYFLFLLSNAQTSVLLNLAKLNPKTASSALILYADILLTASVCVIGFGLALSATTAGEAAHSTHTRIQFQVVNKADKAGNACSALKDRYGSPCTKLAKGRTVVFFQPIPTKQQVRLYAEDMRRTYLTLPQATALKVKRVDDDFQQFIDRSGEVVGFQSLAAGTGWSVDQSSTSNLSPDAICKQLYLPNKYDSYHMKILYISVRKYFLERCIKGLPVSIFIDSALNIRNVDYSSLVGSTISWLAQSLSYGLLGHPDVDSSFDPMRYWSTNGIWTHNHFISESDKRVGFIARDDALLQSYTHSRGVKATMGYTAYPIGLLTFAVMFTSIFSIILFFSAIASMLALKALATMRVFVSYTKLEEHPFAILAPSGAVFLSLCHFVTNIF